MLLSVEWSPSGWKDMTGRVVRVPSIKLREAQNKPDRALVRVSHLPSALFSAGQQEIRNYENNLGYPTLHRFRSRATPTTQRRSRPRAPRPTV